MKKGRKIWGIYEVLRIHNPPFATPDPKEQLGDVRRYLQCIVSHEDLYHAKSLGIAGGLRMSACFIPTCLASVSRFLTPAITTSNSDISLTADYNNNEVKLFFFAAAVKNRDSSRAMAGEKGGLICSADGDRRTVKRCSAPRCV